MRAAAICVVLSVFACGDDGGGNPGDPADAGQQTGCQSASDCSGDTPACDTATGNCVQCTADDADACSGDSPVCDAATNECAACTRHADCAESNVCLPTGGCAAAADVLYVAFGGTDNAECSQAMPCDNLTQALAVTPARAIVKVEGEVAGPTIEIVDRDLTILGDPAPPGGRLAPTLPDTPIMRITGLSNVRMFDLIVSGASGASGIGILTNSGSTGELELQRCTLTNNEIGLQAGTATVLIVNRSIVSFNNEGGMDLGAQLARADITNNFVFRNGNNTTARVGGIIISNAGPGSRLEFNTIVDNEVRDNALRGGGITCLTVDFPASNNIIASNEAGDLTGEADSQVLGGCDFSGSIVLAEALDFQFEAPSSAPFSYRLTSGSIAIDASQVGTPPPTDFDGQPRPNGALADVGADELDPE